MIPAHQPAADDPLQRCISSWYKHDDNFGHIAKTTMVTSLLVSVLLVLLMTRFSPTFPVQVQSPSGYDSYTVGCSEL